MRGGPERGKGGRDSEYFSLKDLMPEGRFYRRPEEGLGFSFGSWFGR